MSNCDLISWQRHWRKERKRIRKKNLRSDSLLEQSLSEKKVNNGEKSEGKEEVEGLTIRASESVTGERILLFG